MAYLYILLSKTWILACNQNSIMNQKEINQKEIQVFYFKKLQTKHCSKNWVNNAHNSIYFSRGKVIEIRCCIM